MCILYFIGIVFFLRYLSTLLTVLLLLDLLLGGEVR